MKAFVITLAGHPYSEAKAKRCIESASDVGRIRVDRFRAIDKYKADAVMKAHGLEWSWANGNTEHSRCRVTGLRQHPYGALSAKIGCSMSHFLLWRKCVEIGEPILILEHDAVFIREFEEFEFHGICQINDPRGATPRGDWWSGVMKRRGPGVHAKTQVFADDVPDGLAGNSAYVIRPFAAQALMDKFREIGVWPNDATMCRQLFPYLEEHFPFLTRVEQEMSTTSI